ncbi:2-hydroxychromene-2-carboxylate isomerase [Novosphingobium hassiacum]|uniref:2-hydroxychromene-2-carboxylate isomerase n=1 Tax=Novosphingobium hassiacum TaxID=173676 RepID=A0A7W6EY30_9SPHN|nr:2-hydroxychromene-2-carboxylate isomerase [Novosphingobium hassiacum]
MTDEAREGLKFYFDFVRPYSYLAHKRLLEFCVNYGLDLD